jgi:hypothetical protein
MWMRLKYRLSFLLTGCLWLAEYSQTQMTKEQFITDSIRIMRPKLVRPQFKFDNRVTFYEGQTLNITGIDAGVLLKSKLRLTLGYYQLNDDLNAFKETIDSIDVGRLVDVDYGALNTEFIYRDTRFFSFGMPLEFGAGMSELKYKNFTSDIIYKRESGVVVMTQFGLSAMFKPIRWFGLKAIIGYRKTLFNQVKSFIFDGEFESLCFNVVVRDIIKDVLLFKVKRRYKSGNNISNAVDLITD